MQFIEVSKIKSKLSFLFLFITLALITIGIIGALNMHSMKKNIDSFYFGSLVPLTELNEILQTYQSVLALTLYKSKDLEIKPSQTLNKLNNSLKEITKVWTSYESHFKEEYEVEYIQYLALEIEKTNKYFLKVTFSLENEKRISHINALIQKLINYEVEVANYERQKFLFEYNQTITRLSLILCMIVGGVLILAYLVFSSIQAEHKNLHLATKKLKKVNKELENVSYTDSLTNMPNRRYFNIVYERELKRAKRTHSHITFMMLDIDFFKQYNDTYGHVEGDRALRAVAKVLKDTLQRPSDFVFRLGGEEFAVLLTQVDESSSAKLAREIGDAIRDNKIPHSGSQVHEFLTISLGVVCCIADDALDENILISRADEMLYEAKDTGRDRYIITSNVSEAKTKKIEDLTA